MLIKLSIVVGAFYFIYNKLTNNSKLDFNEFGRFLVENNVFSLKNITFLVFLSSFNWLFEILKWKTLVASVKTIPFINALKQSLGSLTASLLTPNRIGEYGAKAIYYPKQLRKRIMLINLISNVMQMAVTTILGGIGFYFFAAQYDLNIDYHRVSRFGIIIIVIGILSLFGIKQTRYKIKGFSIEKIMQFIKSFPLKLTIQALLFSFIRYFIFSFQFYYLLQIFGIPLHYLDAMTIITSTYLLSSLAPSIFIFDVIIKGSAAVYLFSVAGISEFAILCIITIMWLLNFVLPSLFGSYYVLKFNLPKDDK